MLNLYDYLTPLDNKRIENYIKEYGVEDGYVGNERYLTFWNNCKKKLFHLLGGELIIKVPYTYIKPVEQVTSEISNAIREYQNFFDSVWEHLQIENGNGNGNLDTRVADEIYYACFSTTAILNNKTRKAVKYKHHHKDNMLQLPVDMKPVRAMQKVIKYFGWDDLAEDFENFRVKLSMVTNEKEVKGNICISIHPLDFMTMSDNASDWSSCMSWISRGCYHAGTVEMMNSNNVVCAYIEGKTPFHFGKKELSDHTGEEWTWNNKKWRQLFYVTKDIIVGGKSYPYANENFTKKVIEILREFAEKNLKWTYTFGPELYRDMIHVGTLYRMDRNKDWIRSGKSIKHNILFDSRGMYNDMFNDNGRAYWCVRNKVKKAKMISYSGKAPCLCCMSPVVEENEDIYYYDEGSYNERYDNVRNVICRDCQEIRHCDYCDNEGYYHTIKELNGRCLCKKCWEEYVKKCPCCGEVILSNSYLYQTNDKFFIRLSDEELFIDDLHNKLKDNSKAIIGYCCKSCKKKMAEDGVIKSTPLYRKSSFYHIEEFFDITTSVYERDSEFVNKFFTNVEKVEN